MLVNSLTFAEKFLPRMFVRATGESKLNSGEALNVKALVLEFPLEIPKPTW